MEQLKNARIYLKMLRTVVNAFNVLSGWYFWRQHEWQPLEQLRVFLVLGTKYSILWIWILQREPFI